MVRRSLKRELSGGKVRVLPSSGWGGVHKRRWKVRKMGKNNRKTAGA